MHFSPESAQRLLSATPKTLHAWLGDLPDPWIHANEGPDTWSAFDVVGHLIHGEKTDWIPRSLIILSDKPDKTFEPFDRYAQQESSKGKTMHELLDSFESLRTENMRILSGLDLSDDNLGKTGIHPEFGTVTLRQLLSTWVVHDQSHIFQIARVLGKQLKDEAGPWTRYIRMIQ